MKRLAFVSLFLFWFITAAVLAAGLIIGNNQVKIPAADTSSNSTVNQGLSSSNSNGQPATVLTVADVAKHNSSSDCWMIINNNVYNLTSFLGSHPGGAGTMIPYCGKDGTVAFDTKDKSNPTPHSPSAQSLLANYYIGTLNKTTVSSVLKNAVGAIAKLFSPTPGSIPTPVPTSIITPIPTNSGAALTIQEVAKHNTANNCWMIISGNVYNFTSYIPGHPGGSAMIPYCGADGTTAFLSGPPHAHSASAQSLLPIYFLGSLNALISTPLPTPTPTPTPVPTPLPTPTPIGSNVILTVAEVAKHNTAGNCWMIISGNVYDFTTYIPSHPGGSAMIPYCGADATTVFLSGPPHAHSSAAQSLLPGYLLGSLNTTVVTTPTPTSNPNSTPTPTPRRVRNDD